MVKNKIIEVVSVSVVAMMSHYDVILLNCVTKDQNDHVSL